MKRIYAEIFGRHAADVIEGASGIKTRGIKVDGGGASDAKPPVCELAVGIPFSGTAADDGAISGGVVCGFVTAAEAGPLMKALADHFGLGEAPLERPDGPADILSELLNIIIGLTGAEWSEHGFEMDFGPPVVVSGRPDFELPESAQIYHIAIRLENGPDVNTVAAFWK
ncbi:MAG: hypothetical protein LBS31_11325 [Candidatus Adiutrix sp.]|jgi:hypothetical protein|nr:hypothetical protein [Candidatus Adiutrix sp.]